MSGRRTLAVVRVAAFVLACSIVVLLVSCGGSEDDSLPQGADPVELDPADFTTEIDNPYWPMAAGTRWVYRAADAEGARQQIVVTVTPETRTIMGIEARVVRDVVVEDGMVVEDTLDWYAQDADGNVWYLGEDTKEYDEHRNVSTAGSWEAGVDGALPGVIVPAEPEVGLAYRQEHYAGEAEDEAEVLGVDEKAEVPLGRYEHALLTRETTPLEPDVLELKLYATGVGPVLAVTLSGGSDREELVDFRKP